MKFVVGYINWGDNELHLEQIEAKDWREAWEKHSKTGGLWSEERPNENLEAAKQFCFDCDCMMSHIEVS